MIDKNDEVMLPAPLAQIARAYRVKPLPSLHLPPPHNAEAEYGLADKQFINFGEHRRKIANVTWREKLINSGGGQPKALLANIITALREAPEGNGALAYDEFACATELRKAPPWEKDVENWRPRKWTGRDDVLLTDWLHHAGIAIRVSDTHTGVEAVAQEHGHHPIRDYLRGLQWDGESRIAHGKPNTSEPITRR
jgi:predicted P-loop ATPase